MQVSKNALKIMKERILRKGETPDNMVERVAEYVSNGDEQLKMDFEYILQNKYFLPNSPCLANAGTELGQLSACFVLPIEDTMSSIMGTLYNASMIQKTGGGTGFSFSRLRPKGCEVQSTGGEASGPISFMRMYNAVMEEVKQGGRRRGASLAVLNIDHPDIIEFIECKHNQDQLQNFNISVGITDEFMKQVQTGDSKAVEIWDKLTEAAWETGEPGVLFLDTINQHNPAPELGQIEACNPCGEATLLPYESCVLGSINLGEMICQGRVNYELIRQTTEIAVKFLDNIIDTNHYPLPEIMEQTKRTRKIGLGVMGLADMLFKLGIAYGGEDSLAVANILMRYINSTAIEKSKELAKEKGPVIGDRRNAVVTSLAPTGTISTIAGCSSGVEPVFALAYQRSITVGEFEEINPVFEQELEKEGLDKDMIIEKVIQNGGSCQGLKELPEHIQRTFITAQDLTWKEHVEMQATLQKHVEQSISKTINFRKNTTVDEVKEACLHAWQRGCKGMTIYRDGSREGQVLTTKYRPKERPQILYGETYKLQTGCGSLYATINRDSCGDNHELFINHSRRDNCIQSFHNALARLVSVSLRSGVDPYAISETLENHDCGNCQDVSSCVDAIAKILSNHNGIQCSLEDGSCQTCD